MLKSHQPPITVEKQVENLETLGCTVENKEEAIEFLNNVSYFRLIKAYGFGLKERNAMYMLTISRFFCIVLLKGGNVYVT